MRLFNGSHPAEPLCQIVEAFVVRILGKPVIHVAPLVILALGSGQEIGGGPVDMAQLLKPDTGVLLLIAGGFQEDLRQLIVAFAAGDLGEISILVAGLALAGKGLGQILGCLGACIGIRGGGRGWFHLDKDTGRLLAAGTDEVGGQRPLMEIAANRAFPGFHMLFLPP